jgi:hypothetical protein
MAITGADMARKANAIRHENSESEDLVIRVCGSGFEAWPLQNKELDGREQAAVLWTGRTT